MSTTMRPMNSLSVMSPHARARGARAASLPFAAKTSRDVALPVAECRPSTKKGWQLRSEMEPSLASLL